MLRLTVFIGALVALSHQQSCPSKIPEGQRRDCFPGQATNEYLCRARRCIWCPASAQGAPWCFYDEDVANDIYKNYCTPNIAENQRVDCTPEPGSTDLLQQRCGERNCIWCPTATPNIPWCYRDTTGGVNPTTGTAVTSSPVTGSPVTAGTGTITCPVISDSQRVDCHPEAGSTQQSCNARGCGWCPTAHGIPWCIYTDPSMIPTGSPITATCDTTIPEAQRIDCYPDLGATTSSCQARGCIWCSSKTPGVPWCFFNSENWPSALAEAERVDCLPEGKFDSNKCLQRGCVLGGVTTKGAPVCYFPADIGYNLVGEVSTTARGMTATLQKNHEGSLFGGDMQTVSLLVEYQTEGRLRIKFSDPSKTRFEVPMDIVADSTPPSQPLYEVEIIDSPAFAFRVSRRSTGEVLFDTSIGGLVLSDQFLQVAARLPTSKVYGFGEHEHPHYRHDMNYQSWGMWTRDQPPYFKANLYGVHPFFMGVDSTNQAYGVFFKNSAAQDVTMGPLPSVTYRTIGGILDIYFFAGPTAENVIQQYTAAIGRPVMPPYWALGFQLSRYGYDSIATVKATIGRMRSYDIPHDVQYGDIDYFDRQIDFTYNKNAYAGMPEYVKQLKTEGTRFITILDPCITTGEPRGSYKAYDLGMKMGVFINESDGVTPALGKVWPPDPIYFPDYTNPVTTDWWVEVCKDFKKVIDFDGIWIDMNEPANFVSGGISGCKQNSLNYPPYYPRIWGNVLQDKTCCPDFKQFAGNHYDVHNLYGWSQSPPTLKAARESTGKRSLVLSRSTYPGSGKTAVHWLGDNFSRWSNLHFSIIGMLEFNLFGIPYIGADICGFIDNTNRELCLRWMQLGAFYTFSRNHNGYGYREQDPAAWDDEFARVSRETLHIRYTLLPYLYTLHHRAHVDGNTAVRALFHEFPGDEKTYDIDTQFMWGSGFLISPALAEEQTSVQAYFPNARWYSWYDGVEVQAKGATATIAAPLSFIPLHVRGGSVLPTQQPARSTMVSRTKPMGLIVALNENNQASGSLFWDDGESIDTYEKGQYFESSYNVANNQLTATVVHSGFNPNLTYNQISVYGLSQSASRITVNGAAHTDFSYSASTKVLKIFNLSAQVGASLTVSWS